MGIFARMFETRAHPKDPVIAEWWGQGNDTATGLRVDETGALSYAAVFACVRILAESVASLPLVMFERTPEGKQRAPQHPLYTLLHDLPNPEMTSLHLRETLMGHLALWGNAYANIVWSRGGQVLELWPLRPDRMRVAREDGQLRYYYRVNPGDAERTIPARDVLHVAAFSQDGTVGLSPLSLFREAVGLGLAAQEFGARFFGNDARPGAVLQHPGALSDEAFKRLQQSWESRHQGLDKSHRVAILEEGMTINEIGIPPEDAQFLETRKFQVTEIARVYRVPPHMLADLDRATFSNIEHQSLEFVMHTLRPWLVRWEQALSRDLLTPAERVRYFPEFVVDGLLRGDIQSRYQAYAVGRQNGWLSANDIRDLENMNRVEGGDVYLVPLNMIPADRVGELGSSEPTPMPEQGRSLVFPDEQRVAEMAAVERRAIEAVTARNRIRLAYVPVFEDAIGRVLRREANDVGNRARRVADGGDSLPAFLAWADEFYQQHTEFVYRNLTPVLLAYAEMVGDAAADEVNGERGDLETFVKTYLAAYAARHAIKSLDDLRQALEDDGAQEALEEVLTTWRETRPNHEARSESSRAGSAIAKAVFAALGVMKLRWVTVGDNCPYCTMMNGRTVAIDAWFVDAGQELAPQGFSPMRISRKVGHPPVHDGCDCGIAAA